MAENDTDQEDRTEDATPERRDDFRERGQIAHSKELTNFLALGAVVVVMSSSIQWVVKSLEVYFIESFQMISNVQSHHQLIQKFAQRSWLEFLTMSLPFLAVVGVIASFVTLLQTRFNFSWKKLEVDFTRMNPITGFMKLFSFEAVFELIKASLKITIMSFLVFLVLKSEWKHLPSLINTPPAQSWIFFFSIVKQVFAVILGVSLFIALADYIYNFTSIEKKMKMSKQEVKEEVKQRESDPHVKARIKKMARDISQRRTVEKTKTATVIITNPTHYSIALRYEIGMPAPIVVAKGVDFLALRMREIAKDFDIPLYENKPLARALYDQVKEGDTIPSDLYKAVSEVIRYIFRIKGIRIPSKQVN